MSEKKLNGTVIVGHILIMDLLIIYMDRKDYYHVI